jgi:RNA polymerase sigma-B factor
VIEAIDLGEARSATSIDAESDDGFAPAAAALAVRDAGMAGAELRADLAELLSVLPPREREIIRLRFIEDLTQAEIGAKLGLSQMHVSRLLRQSIARLRQQAEPRSTPA